MKKTTIGMVLLCAILLGSCTKEAEMKNEALPQNTETTMDAFKPMTFEQTRALVGEVLGSDVAERIEPTSRYVRVQFDDANLMCEYYMRGAAELSPVPLLGEQVAEAAVSDDKPRPMYALIDRDIALPEHAECEVLAEYFDPASPLSGLTAEQAEKVCGVLTASTRATDLNWYPSGDIQIYDELAGAYVPVVGVEVVVTGYNADSGEFLQTETCVTDSEGRFTCKKMFMGFVAEYVKWANDYWNIMEDNANVASTYSSYIDRYPWHLEIRSTTADRALQFATAYRAAEYMHRNGYEISNLKGTSTVNIRCLDEVVPINSDDRFEQATGNKNGMNLFIYCKRKSALDIHSVVQRELGKAVHNLRINASTNDYTDYNKIVTESWGEFTKYYFTDREYAGLNALNKIHTFAPEYQAYYGFVPARPDELNKQDWFYNTSMDANSQCRTPMFIDILDEFDQGVWPEYDAFPASIIYPEDEFFSPLINGFRDLETWSRQCKTVDDVKSACAGAVGPYAGPQQAIKKLFKVYDMLEQAL